MFQLRLLCAAAGGPAKMFDIIKKRRLICQDQLKCTGKTRREVIMFGSEILEVALGLVFVYLLASTACSAIREGIAKILKTRAKNLEKELFDILKSTELVQALYQHQLIREPQAAKAKKRPPKISTDKFAAALLDTLMNTQKGETKGFNEIKEGIEKIENAQIRGALLEILNSAASDLGSLKKTIEEVRKSIEE